jgi:hypothetical protein
MDVVYGDFAGAKIDEKYFIPLKKNTRLVGVFFEVNFSFFTYHFSLSLLAFHRIKKLSIRFRCLQLTHKELNRTNLIHRL